MTSYTLTRSHRKTLAIHIKPDGSVEVKAPLRLAKADIERFITSNLRWIKQKQAQVTARQANIPRELPPLTYKPGEFELISREFVKAWEICLGVKVAFVGFRAMTTRFGSCTARTRRIRLNTALAYAPQGCLEYVIVHEMAHILENNHSPRFWALVAAALPDYKIRRKELKALSWLLEALN